MALKKQTFCYFWIKVIDAETQIKDDAAQLASASRAPASGGTVIVDPVTANMGTTVVVDPVTAHITGATVVVDPVTSNDFTPVTQWTESTDGSATITIDTVPRGYVAADPGMPFTTDYITLKQTFTEETARAWIETEEGKRWRGNAKVCVLHQIVVSFGA